MVRRLTLLLVVSAPVGLLTVFGPPRLVAPSSPDANFDLPDADTPIVAIRGQALAEHEEPLPPGARVRFGSTRFRDPKGLDRWQAQVAGPYFVSQDDGKLNLTDIASGRRVWNQPLQNRGGDLDFPCVTARPDGRLVVWNFGDIPKSRIVARVSEAISDPAQPIRFVTTLRIPEATGADSVDAVFFPEERSEIWVLAKGIHAFDASSGQHLRHVRTKNRILALDRRGTRFLTSSEHDPRFQPELLCGSFRLPTFSFRPKALPEPTMAGKPRLRRLMRDGLERDTNTLTLMVANARTGESVFAIAIPRVSRYEASHLDLSPDGRYLSFEADSCLTVFDIDREKPILELDTWEGDRNGRRQQISESWFSDDGRRFTVTGIEIGEIQFDLTTGLEVTPQGERPMKAGWFGLGRRNAVVSEEGVLRRPTNEPPPPGYARVVLAYSPELRLIAIGDATGRLDIWQQDGRLVRSLPGGGKAICAVAFSQNGQQVAACDHDRVMRIWTVKDWRESDRFEVPAAYDKLYPEHLIFSPDGRQLLVSRDDIMTLWDFETRKWLWDIAGFHPLSTSSRPAFVPDGSRIMFPSQNAWVDPQAGQLVPAIAGSDMGQHMTMFRWDEEYGPSDEAMGLSADGSHFAYISEKGFLQTKSVLGASSQKFPESKTVRKKHGILRYSPDGHRLVTCDDRGHAHVWEVASGQLAFTLTYPDGAIHDVHFGNDGRTLITSNHREVIVWDLLENREPVTDPWTDLGHDAPRAEQARRALLANPDAAVDMLRVKLRPAAPLSETDIGRLIRSLDADDYRSRDKAAAGLLAAGRRVLPWLKAAKLTSPEGIARQAALEQRLAAGLTPNELRQVRGIEVLEQINTPAARKLIDQLTTGDPAAVATEEARRSIRASQLSTGADRPGNNGNSSKSRARQSATTSRPLVSPSLANTTYRAEPMTTPTGKDRGSTTR
jgi:WD40 repeat protein